MKKILLSGFKPLGGYKINPSWEIAKRLRNKKVKGVQVIGLRLPVVFGEARQQLIKAIKKYQPAIVLALGQHNSSPALRIERLGMNIHQGLDENQKRPNTKYIIKHGPPAYFATLPFKPIIKRVSQQGIPIQISYSAGSYLCNEILYSALHYRRINNLSIKIGFIHVPLLPKQARQKPGTYPSMPLKTAVKAIKLALETCV